MTTPGGQSFLRVDVPEALPKPPDVAVEHHVPGGALVPCTGKVPPGSSLVRRNNYPLDFEGSRASINRIAVSLAVVLKEWELETSGTTQEIHKEFSTETEAQNFVAGKEGLTVSETTRTPIGPTERGVSSHSTTTTVIPEADHKKVEITETTNTERSVLPITVTVALRINGPNGPIWSDSFQADIFFQVDELGLSIGTGIVEQYVDLSSPLELDATKIYGLELLVFIPTGVKTDTRLGTLLNAPAGKEATLQEGTLSNVTFYYEFDNGPANK